MATKTPTIERFRLVIEQEFEAPELGGAIASLTRLGFTNVRFELITDVHGYRRNNRQQHEVTAEDFLAAWIAEHPTFTTKEVSAYFKANNRSVGAAYYALSQLVEKKTLKKLSPQNYARADVKHIAAPEKTKAGKAKTAVQKPKHFDKPATAVILSHARRNHGRLNTSALIKLFAQQGRARGSVYGSVNKLLESRLIKRIGASGSGDYELTAKAKTETAPKPNGNGAHIDNAPEVVTHG